MAWRVARSLDVLLNQLNTLAPRRSRVSDGSIGDAAHQAQGSASDHNPWYLGNVVTARDFTHDPANGLDCNKLAAALIASRDPRIKYLIWQGRIVDSRPQFRPWTWQPSSGHYQHLHLSVMPNTSADDPRPWSLPGLTNPLEDDMPFGGVEADFLLNREVTIQSPANPKYEETHLVKEWLGRSYYWGSDTYHRVLRLEAKVDALTGALSDDEANILAAVREASAPDAPTDYERLGKSIAANLPAPSGGVSPEDLERELNELFGRVYRLNDTTEEQT